MNGSKMLTLDIWQLSDGRLHVMFNEDLSTGLFVPVSGRLEIYVADNDRENLVVSVTETKQEEMFYSE